ncbi:glycosyltransferase [Pseudomaricurvus sp. HS19]|uniref:glycosyltransferase n=1 Tax=Pseudomaricurvus sp. HS19 TaxID=2692626 RepID=UPI001928848D|nr:glycosyltransferase [Pseudomaricurvus sp. HS19]
MSSGSPSALNRTRDKAANVEMSVADGSLEEVLAPECCIMFATADWDEPYWTNKQHCAKSLAAVGTKVLYVESVGLRGPKAASKKDWRRLISRAMKGLASFSLGAVERDKGVFVLSPLVIPAGYRFSILRWLNKVLLGSMLRRAGKKLCFDKPLIWTYHPFMLDVVIDKSGPLLYHCVDDLAAVPGVDAQAFRSAEESLLRRADAVFATAPALAEHCRKLNLNTHYLPNVVDYEHFSAARKVHELPPDLSAIPEPRLGYVGVLSDFKVDFELIFQVARAEPAWHWVLIGEEREGQSSELLRQLREIPNVHFLGHKSYRDLPGYLAGFQVATLPSLINKYTDSMFPMKYFEYISAGKRVVATPLAFTRSPNIEIATALGEQKFREAVASVLQRGGWSEKESLNIVGENTWERRLSRMLRELFRQQSPLSLDSLIDR